MAVDATGGIILVVIVQKFNSVHFPLSEYKGCYKELCSKVRQKQLWFPRKLQKKLTNSLISSFSERTQGTHGWLEVRRAQQNSISWVLDSKRGKKPLKNRHFEIKYGRV